MLRVFVILIFVVVALLIVGVVIGAVNNEQNRITEGIVVDKDYTAAYTTFTMVNKIMIPHYHSESYQLCISGEKDGEIVEYWFGCTADEYNSYNVGDYYQK